MNQDRLLLQFLVRYGVLDPPAKQLRGDACFERWFIQLVEFKRVNGNCRVPANTKLGWWLKEMRRASRGKGMRRITPEQIERLRVIGVFDVMLRGDACFERWFIQLVEYKRMNGHCRPPSKTKLGQWVKAVTDAYRGKGKTKCSEEQLRRLEAMGTFYTFRDASLDKHLKELEEFKRVNGHCNVRKRIPFGLWLCNTRCAIRRGEASERIVERLLEIGALHGRTGEAVFERRFCELVEYKRLNGDANVPQRYGGLGAWLNQFRMAMKGKSTSHRVTPERIRRLRELGVRLPESGESEAGLAMAAR
jgi:hypothetical protein